MPYGSQYTYTPTAAGIYPSEYVYYPSYGWTWVTAPWVFGWGVRPYFGVYGAAHFGWYNHYAIGGGGWRGYGYRPASGYARPGYGAYGRPAVGGYRSGYAAPHAYAPAARSYGSFGGHAMVQGRPGGFATAHVGGFGGGAHFGGSHVGGFGGAHFGGGGGGHFGGGGGAHFGGGGGTHFGSGGHGHR
jgi:hypothetical protein